MAGLMSSRVLKRKQSIFLYSLGCALFFHHDIKWLLYLQASHLPSKQEKNGIGKKYIRKARAYPARRNCVILAARESEKVTTLV